MSYLDPAIAVIDPVAAAGPYGGEGTALGFRVICVLTQEYRTPYITQTFDPADFSEVYQHSSIDETVAFLKGRGVVAVVPGAPPSLKIVDVLAESLGLIGNPTESLEARRNKRVMKEYWTRHGVPCAAFHESGDLESIISWADGHRYPVVLKPNASVGGVHVFVCANRQEVVDAFNVIVSQADPYHQRFSTVLAEEYLDGDEYFMDLAHAGDGEAVPIAFAKYEKIQRDGNASIYRNMFSLPLDDPIALAALPYVRSVNDALDVRYGINDTEFKMTSRGLRVVEVNNRLPGASVPLMIQKCSGLNVFQENIRIFVDGRRTSGDHHFERHYNICCLINDEPGVVQSYAGLEGVRELPSYDGERMIAPQGVHWPVTRDLDGCWGLIRLVHEDREQLFRDAEAVHGMMRLLVA
ncbi:ATP-grasp domain-containing protein [Micromonospora sp. NPDC004704]